MSRIPVSILIPAHNAAEWLDETLESALAQTCPDKEVIVVENGSTDNTADIARCYTSRGVKAFFIPATTAAHARNFAFSKAQGEFIQYLDADDLLSPGKIMSQLTQLDPTQPILSMSARVEFFDGAPPSESPVQTGWPFIASTDPKSWLADLLGAGGRGGFVALHQWLTPRILIEQAGPWDESLTVNDDGEFFSRVLMKAGEIRTSLADVAYYRRHKQGRNLSSSYRQEGRHLESMLHATELIATRLLTGNTDPRLPAALARHFYECALFCHPLHPDASRRAEIRALQLNPAARPPVPTSYKAALVRRLFGWRFERLLAHRLASLRRIR